MNISLASRKTTLRRHVQQFLSKLLTITDGMYSPSSSYVCSCIQICILSIDFSRLRLASRFHQNLIQMIGFVNMSVFTLCETYTYVSILPNDGETCPHDPPSSAVYTTYLHIVRIHHSIISILISNRITASAHLR
jgi:hypothetical protein